jgi:hypothetical protein
VAADAAGAVGVAAIVAADAAGAVGVAAIVAANADVDAGVVAVAGAAVASAADPPAIKAVCFQAGASRCTARFTTASSE